MGTVNRRVLIDNFSPVHCCRGFGLVAACCLFLLALPVVADEHGTPGPSPGFRPYSKDATAFVDALDDTTISVYPTIVRRSNRTAYSFASRAQIIALLSEQEIAAASSDNHRVDLIDLSALQAQSQWDLFVSDMQRISEDVKARQPSSEYHFFLEFLLPVSDQNIFGIQFYILDKQGNNAFSFLLNSHHRLFVDANLTARDTSEEARSEMLARATKAAVNALKTQIEQARDPAMAMAETGAGKSAAGVFDDFESGLPAGADPNGLGVGFIAFTDGNSTARISTTDAHPPLPGESEGNHVLQLELKVSDWAGFANIFHYQGDFVNSWTWYDWRAFDGFSFWLHGQNSGTAFFVDVLDNRKFGSVVDDAERFVYEFSDDFAGWRRIDIPFAKMRRKEIGNGAPNDGLGLAQVHGWAFGALSTDGPMTWYIDEFTLWSTNSDAE